MRRWSIHRICPPIDVPADENFDNNALMMCHNSLWIHTTDKERRILVGDGCVIAKLLGSLESESQMCK